MRVRVGLGWVGLGFGLAYSTSGEAVNRIVKPTSNYFGSSHY